MIKKQNFIDGYKVYIAGGLTILTGLVGWILQEMDMLTAWEIILVGWGIIGFRSMMKKKE